MVMSMESPSTWLLWMTVGTGCPSWNSTYLIGEHVSHILLLSYTLNNRRVCVCVCVCCCSVTKSCLTLRDPMNCSMPGFPVLHHLLEYAQVHVHWICDTIPVPHLLYICISSEKYTDSNVYSYTVIIKNDKKDALFISALDYKFLSICLQSLLCAIM